jgi:hypothetical protein
VCLCQSRLAISQDAIFGAEQKGKAYWKRMTVDYHEHLQIKPLKIHSDHGQVSIQKRWSLIQQETNPASQYAAGRWAASDLNNQMERTQAKTCL